MTTFHHAALRELTDQQVRFAPPARKAEQVGRAAKLLADVEPARKYPYQFVCFRITEYRPDNYPELLISGDDLKHDLCLFMDAVARSLPPVPVEQTQEPVYTAVELSKLLNVSTKTVTRWRQQGLVGRRVLCNGRTQVGFAKSAVDQFVAGQRDRVDRGARFSHLSESEKEDILRRAKRLTTVGGTLTEVSRRIARRLGRSPEAVRYTIKNYDREHPESALFPAANGPLTGAAKQDIFNLFQRGMNVDTLAKQYGRTRSSVYRVINEVKAERLLALPLDYIYHESFDDPAAEADILAPMPDEATFEAKRRAMKVPKDVPPELSPLYEMPLLSKDQEQHLFRQMNYLKHKMRKIRDRLAADTARARASDFAELDALQDRYLGVKDRLIKCNMRLVISIAKRHSGQMDNFWELISDGNMSLIRAVEKFDYSRGNKFSTYASWAIMKNFARSIPDERKHREHYVTGHEDVFDAAADNRSDEHEALAAADQAKTKVNNLLDRLDPRDREIIRLRVGMDGGEELTLEEIGQRLGITKERVRQLNVRAMKKLRDLAATENAEMS